MDDAEGPSALARARLTALFETHRLELTRFAIRRLGEAAASDVVSETFLVAWRRLDDIPPDDRGARAWLYTASANVIRNELRVGRRRDDLILRAARERESRVDPADHAQLIVERLLVQQVLGQLSERDQEVLRLSAWERLTAPEAAAVLGCSVVAFKVRLHRARRRFSEVFDQHQSRPDDSDEHDETLFPLTLILDEGAPTQ